MDASVNVYGTFPASYLVSSSHDHFNISVSLLPSERNRRNSHVLFCLKCTLFSYIKTGNICGNPHVWAQPKYSAVLEVIDILVEPSERKTLTPFLFLIMFINFWILMHPELYSIIVKQSLYWFYLFMLISGIESNLILPRCVQVLLWVSCGCNPIR